MTVQQRDVGRRTVLTVAGEVDLATSPDLREAIAGAIDSGAHELWVDLCGTSFMDSSGLHVLIDANERAKALRRRLSIVCPPGNVRRIFDLTGLAVSLPVYDDVGSAQRAA